MMNVPLIEYCTVRLKEGRMDGLLQYHDDVILVP
jgi:hypothetical protein